MTFTIEIEREDGGRGLAEIPGLSGVMVYGQDRDEAGATFKRSPACDC